MTVPESPSLLLQRAAERIEQRAAEATQGTWTIQSPDYVVTNIDCGKHSVAFEREEGACDQEDARWICMMSPAVAAPLVAWLRQSADHYNKLLELADGDVSWMTDWHTSPVFEFARLILGEPRKD